MSNEKEFEIMVNGTEHDVSAHVVTYDQVVEIAFPGHPNNPDIVYAVTFEHADQHPKQGTLESTGSVIIKKHGTIFDVTPTNRS
jgi:Multiubiquitin